MKFTRRDSVTLLISSLVLGVFIDILARQSIFGLNFLIWTALWVVIAIFADYSKKRLTPRFILLASFAVLNALLVYIRAEPVVQAWSVIITLISLLLLTGSLYAKNFLELSIMNRVMEYLTGVVNTITDDAKKILRALTGRPKSKQPLRVSGGVVIALFLGLIFIGLFSGSDEIFKDQFSFIGDFFNSIGSWLGNYDIGRVVTITFWVCFAGATLLAMAERDKLAKEVQITYKKSLSGNDPLVILGTLCTVFGFFILIQIKYLFAGSRLPDNLTYATYARRGYGELLLATMLASAVIYATIALAKDTARTKARIVLSNLLVVLNGIVIFSAWKRLSLYESAYGWTMPRFVARLGLVCILLGSVLLLLWVNHRLTSRRLFGYGWHMVAVVLMAAALLNPIGIITQKNLTERSKREEPLDTAYLSQLSRDSYPALCKYAHQLKASHPDEYKSLRDDVDNSLAPSLNNSSHGLSAHYTQSNHFKQYYDCLR